MSFCPQCGTELYNGSSFCGNCGCSINNQAGRSLGSVNSVSGLTASPVAQTTRQAPTFAQTVPFQLKTNRSLLKFILLSMITFGIYGIVVMSVISTDINTIASKYDGRKTMHYCLVLFIFTWLTFGIVPIIWCHNLCERIGVELRRRGIAYKFSAGTYWLWGILGSIIFVGPFVYIHKLFKAMNLLAEDYNIHG